MIKLKSMVLAVLAIAAASGAQAATGVMDFEGFTVSYDASPFWEEGRTSYDYSMTYANVGYYAASGWVATNIGGGVQSSQGAVSFGNRGLPEVQSFGGQGNDIFTATFSYNVQAKPGWELSRVTANHSQKGTYLEFKGGSTTIAATSEASATGGYASGYGDTTMSPTVFNSSLSSGMWTMGHSFSADGNLMVNKTQGEFDTNGNWTGYTQTFELYNMGAPLTAMAGNFSEQISASTSSPIQIAYVGGNARAFSIEALAVRTISPVPEADSYAMMAAALAMTGFIARRKSKTTA